MYHRNTTPQFITTPTYQVRSYDGIPLIDENEQRRRSIPTTTYGNSPPALDAVKPTLGPQPESGKFYRGNGVALAMKDKVFTLTGDDFIVRMVDGEDVVKCKTKFVGVHRRKKIVDLEGNDVVCLTLPLPIDALPSSGTNRSG